MLLQETESKFSNQRDWHRNNTLRSELKDLKKYVVKIRYVLAGFRRKKNIDKMDDPLMTGIEGRVS